MVPPYRIIRPTATAVPVLLSVPHCGTLFPDELANDYVPPLMAAPDDTDWFVHDLYNFAAELGITMIHSVYSRWVIDLNRDPKDKPLYSDGRIITALCPTTTFTGEKIYVDGRETVIANEVDRRVNQYYRPYHEQLQTLLDELRQQHQQVLLWECHSIRQFVKTIHPEPLPDLIVGDNDGKSAGLGLADLAFSKLSNSSYQVNRNHPFKGGYITRHFGEPTKGVHAIQLEMTKVNYMDDSEKEYSSSRAGKMRDLLRNVFVELIAKLK